MSDESKERRELLEELRLLSEYYTRTAKPEPSDPDARFSDVLDNLGAMMVEVDERGRIIDISSTVRDILGYEPDELLEVPNLEWVHPDDANTLIAASRETRETGALVRAVFRARHKSGEWRWLEVGSSIPYRSKDGAIHTVSFSRDITLRKRAQEALVESEERYRALAENASDLITEVDATGRLTYVSPSCKDLLGRDPEELLGRNLREITSPASLLMEDREKLLSVFGRLPRPDESSGESPGVEWRFRHPDGSWRVFESKARSYWKTGNERGIVVIARDVTSRVAARRALQDIEERYRLVAQASGDIVSEFDREGRMMWVSPTCETVLGWSPEELIGTTPFATMVHGSDVEGSSGRFMQSVSDEEPVRGSRIRVRHKDMSWRWLEMMGMPFRNADDELRYLSVARDVTERVKEEEERRSLEQRMVQAQKLEGLGIMAGGVAHDFNNLLTPILGHASLALLDLPQDSPVRERLKDVQRAAHRAAALTNQMLTYAGTGPFHLGHVNLSELVKEIGELIESAASGKVHIEYALATALAATEGDSSQLSQVVMNLITNAVEAAGDREGRVVVSTGAMRGDEAGELSYGELDPEASYVYFEVRDDGCGMDAETRDRIFDPFFSTKFTGRGLGLAAVLGIVRGHEGAIEIESEPDRGTRFRVILPCTLVPPPSVAAPTPSTVVWRTEGLAMVVDDDESVRRLAGDTLERCGLRVLYAANGHEALDLFRQHVGEVRIVVLDRTMPISSGGQALSELRSIRPDVKVILISGYSQESLVDELANGGLAGFIQKPFEPTTLLQKVREALEEGSSA